MTHMTDTWVIPWLEFLVGWSLRWGLLLAALAFWLALRPPRRAATRHLLCLAALGAGVLLPVAPRWAEVTIPWMSSAPAPAPAAQAIAVAAAEVPATPTHPLDSASTSDFAVSKAEPIPRNPLPASHAASFRQFSPVTEALGAWRVAALAAAVAWATIVLALLIRLAAGRLMLTVMRAKATSVGRESDQLVGDCQAALGLSRPVRIATHPAVASPVVVGGRRPMVLVPPDWGDWPELHRRDCLLHELAHLARFDDWAKFAQELVRAPFFFHPMVSWLLARLDRERELLCDEAVVAVGSDPVAFARLLFDLARRPGRLLPVTPGTRPAWLPFLDRRTVAVRVTRLLEDDMPRTLSRPSAVRSFFLGVIALAAALGIGGIRIRAVAAQEPAESPKQAQPPKPSQAPAAAKPAAPAKPAAAAGPKAPPTDIAGVVLDDRDQPVAGATFVAGAHGPGRSGHQVSETDARGRFQWPLPPGSNQVCLIAHKDGFEVRALSAPANSLVDPHDVKIRLGKPAPFAAVLLDDAGKPVSGAQVRVEMIARSSSQQDGPRTMVSTSYEQIPREVITGSPVEQLFVTRTDASGSFEFRALGPDEGLRLAVRAADGRELLVTPGSNAVGSTRQLLHEQGFVTAPPGETTRLVASPAARVAGRVTSALPGVAVSELTAFFQDSHQPGKLTPMTNFGEEVRVDDEGRFAFERLAEGTINVFVHGVGENEDWTYRAAKDVRVTSGATSEVTIELIRGVKVEGSVVAQSTGSPVARAQVGVYGPFRPRTGAMTTSAMTDDLGRYHYLLPAGETYFYVMGPPEGFTRLPGEDSSRTVTIPDSVTKFEVPPLELASAVTLRGRVLDATSIPIAGATVVGTCEGGVCRQFPGTEAITDARGDFRLPPSLYNTVAIGKPARLLIRLRDGAEHEAATLPAADGVVTVKLPVAGEIANRVEGPREVAPGVLAGVVVDLGGKPIEGAEVDAWTWYPGNEAKTDARGFFRIGNLQKGAKVQVVVRKHGYTPQLFMTQPTGKPGWVIVLGNKTYFEGRVTGPDGKPAAGARIRANNGPKPGEGVMISEIWTETVTGDDGRYRLYAQQDIYDIQVRVPGVGVARLPGTSLQADEAKHLDIRLESGATLRAKVVDSLTGEPVPGVRLWHWQHPGVEGRSGNHGYALVVDMLPGRFNFQIDAPGYTRWWSEEAASEWCRRKLDEAKGGWQRNFDQIDFDLKTGMNPVTIAVERAVTVTGRVLDPDGKPVAGATVAPALTGSGNSLTGDTRFSVRTDKDGRFTALLPASGVREYNLVAHDGAYTQWRTWANGVLPPFRTKPGESVGDIELRLTRPATVRGKVTGVDGRPVAGREVRSSAADRLENRYYDPTVSTAADGSYELKFIRPGEQFIQVAPFWLDAKHAPEGTNQTLMLKPGESKEHVDFRVPGGADGRANMPTPARPSGGR